jgi:hypothetical protein
MPMRSLTLAVLLAAVIGASSSLTAQSGASSMAQEPACQSLTPVGAGGPAPKDPNLLVLRWLGHTNYEFAYRDQVILFDAYFERNANLPPIGVSAKDFKKVNAIVVGHAHGDHIEAAPEIAKNTGATIIGARFGSDVARKFAVPDAQNRTVTGKGRELFEYHGFSMRPMLGHHNIIGTTVPEGYGDASAKALAGISLVRPLTEAEQKVSEARNERSSRDPLISTEGTIGYYFEFTNNFRVLYIDSPGPITDYQRQLMATIPNIDVLTLPYVSRDAGIPFMVDMVKLYKPGMVFIGHHDAAGVSGYSPTLWPYLQVREASPNTLRMETLYRTPVCINTATKEVFVGGR